jgi:hypothetical protein
MYVYQLDRSNVPEGVFDISSKARIGFPDDESAEIDAIKQRILNAVQQTMDLIASKQQ